MPKTLKDLMELKETQRILDVPGKCGIELRPYTHRLYGGYFYTNSLDEGQTRYEEVRKILPKRFKMLLKRGCTEMEMVGGPSDWWVIADNHLELDAKIDTYCKLDAEVLNKAMGDLSYNKIMQLWVDWAYAVGDETYKEFTDGMPLYPAPVTYHEKDSGAIKVQLAANRLERLHRIPPQVVGEAFMKLGETGMSREALGRLQGFHNLSPFTIGDHLEIT
jgi:hypothetical protein